MAIAAYSAEPTRSPTEVARPSKPLFVGLALLALALPWAVVFWSLRQSDLNFPINDDWAFGKGAFGFAAGLKALFAGAKWQLIDYHGWSSMPLLGQWLWAFPFIEVLGESFVTLRIATIVLSWLALAAYYDLLRQGAGLPVAVALFTTVALGLGPYFFWLSGTFMTDVPALAFSLIALALYWRAFQGGGLWPAAVAALVALLGAVTRQNTVVVPVAAGVLLWLRPGLCRDWRLWILVLVPLAVCVGAHVWLQARLDVMPRGLGLPGWRQAIYFPFIVLHFLGIWALPALALAPPRAGPDLRRDLARLGVALAAMTGVAALVYATQADHTGQGLLFPYLDVWFPEAYQVHGYYAEVIGMREVRWLFTVAGCVGGAALLTRLAWLVRVRAVTGPLLVFSVCHLPLLLASPVLYDRYLLILVPGALALAALPAVGRRPLWAAGLATLGVLTVFAVGMEHDILAWNAARWQVGRRALIERSIPSAAIEGGLEWDGLFAPAPALWHDPKNPAAWRRVFVKGMTLLATQASFPHLSGEYAISYSEIPGTEVVDSERYARWLGLGDERRVYLLRWTPDYSKYRDRIMGPPNARPGTPPPIRP